MFFRQKISGKERCFLSVQEIVIMNHKMFLNDRMKFFSTNFWGCYLLQFQGETSFEEHTIMPMPRRLKNTKTQNAGRIKLLQKKQPSLSERTRGTHQIHQMDCDSFILTIQENDIVRALRYQPEETGLSNLHTNEEIFSTKG